MNDDGKELEEEKVEDSDEQGEMGRERIQSTHKRMGLR